MQPSLLIALISVVTIVLLAVVAASFTLRHKREPSPVPGRWLTLSDEGSVALPLRAAETEPAHRTLGKQALATLAKEQQASALDHQVDDVISRFILES